MSDDGKPSERQHKKQRKARRAITHTTLGELWDDVPFSGSHTLAHTEFGVIEVTISVAINQLMGWETEPGDVLAIQGDDVRHIKKNHGIKQKHKGKIIGETRHDQLPIEKADFERLKEIFDEPLFAKDNDPEWGEILLVKRVFPDGQIIAAALHTSSKKMLHVKSMRKLK